MIRFYYDQAPSEGGPGLVEFTSRVNLADENVSVTTSAEQGAVATSSFIVDDPDGDWSTNGHRMIWIIEDDAPAENQLVYWGYAAARPIGRRDGPKDGAARKWTLQLTDVNTILARKVMAGNDTDRPEDETDVDRMQWVAGTGEAGNIADWTTFLATSSPVAMSDSNYNGQMLSAIVDDCAQQSMKNYYMRWLWDAGASDYVSAIWYGHDTVAAAISTLRISNVEEDVDDSTTWAASLDSEWTPDPSRIYSGMFANYDGGYTYQTNFDTLDEFANRDTVTSWPNVKKHDKAVSRAQTQLARLNTEEETITTYIMVPPANVNDAMAGDQIDVKFSHFPGFEDFRSCRILERTVTFVTPEFYRINFTLTPNAIVPESATFLVALINMGGPGSLTEPTDLSGHAWTKAFWTGNYASAGQNPGPGGAGSMGMWYRAVVPGETANVITVQNQSGQALSVWVFEIDGWDGNAISQAHNKDVYVDPPSPTMVSPSASATSVWFAAQCFQKVNYGQFTMMTTSPGTEVLNTNGFNATPVCAASDPNPPAVFASYIEGTGTLTVGNVKSSGTCTFWTGANPNYNSFGRGWGGVLIPLTAPGAFSIVQRGFGYAVSADVGVTLPSLP